MERSYTMKKLYRSKKNRLLGGICGGIGEFSSIDPTIIRLLFLFGAVATGFFPLVLAYFVALFIIPSA